MHTKTNLTIKIASDSSDLIVILADDGFNQFRIPLTLEDAEQLKQELTTIIERKKDEQKL